MTKMTEDKEKQIEEMASDMDYGCTKRDLYPSDAKEIAKALYLLGYQKIPKDSVVLSKEEWREYVDNENEAYYRGQHEAEVYYKNIQIPRERKEMAEKILKSLYDACKEDTYGQVVVDFTILENFAKQLGVEIKE